MSISTDYEFASQLTQSNTWFRDMAKLIDDDTNFEESHIHSNRWIHVRIAQLRLYSMIQSLESRVFSWFISIAISFFLCDLMCPVLFVSDEKSLISCILKLQG